MSSINIINNKLQDLINQANQVTGNNDADLSTAINTLVVGYGTGGGGSENLVHIIDVTELPSENIDEQSIYRMKGYDASIYVVQSDGSTPLPLMTFLASMGATSITVDTYLVDSLPETFEVSALGGTYAYLHVYILKESGYTYVSNDGSTATPMGSVVGLSEQGWVNSTDEMGSAGIYATKVESANTYGSCYQYIDGAWENYEINPDIFYYSTIESEGSAEIWLSMEGQVVNFANAIASEGVNLIVVVVDELPDSMPFQEGSNAYIYVLKDTGIAYVSQDGTKENATTIGTQFGGDPSFDKGYIDSPGSIDATQNGCYTIYKEGETSFKFYTYTDNEWICYSETDGGIVEVEQLPDITEIDMNVIYKTKKAVATDIYVVYNSNKTSWKSVITGNFMLEVVDKLPTENIKITSGGDFYGYVLASSGLVYSSSDGTTLSLMAGENTKGWISSPDLIPSSPNIISAWTIGGQYDYYGFPNSTTQLARHSGVEWVDMQDEIDKINSEVTTLEGEITTLEGEITTLEGEVTTLEDENSALKSEIEENTPKLNFLNSDTSVLDTGGVQLNSVYGDGNIYIPSYVRDIKVGYDSLPGSLNVFIDDLASYCKIANGFATPHAYDGLIIHYLNGVELTEITGSDITEIGNHIFQNANINKVNLDKVTSFGTSCFGKCPLTEISLLNSEENPVSLGVNTIEKFSYGDWLPIASKTLKTVNFGSGVDGIDLFLQLMSNIENISIDENNPYFYAENNCIIDKENPEVMLKGFSSTSEIPSGVVYLEPRCFYECTLNELKFPASFVSLFNPEWYDEPLSYYLNDVFLRCSIQSLKVDEENPVLHDEGNCIIETSTNTLILGCENSVIPSYVTIIEQRAFSGVSKATIPHTVLQIKSQAFDCVQEIIYEGTKEEWKQIIAVSETGAYSWYSERNGDAGDYTIYCTDGTIAKDGTET